MIPLIITGSALIAAAVSIEGFRQKQRRKRRQTAEDRLNAEARAFYQSHH